jgi:DNA polymerase elongation subunit (family B)
LNIKPKILLLDIESSPNVAYVWGKWQQDVIEYQKEWQLLSFAYKWLGDKEVHCITKKDFHNKSDKPLVKQLWNVINEADIIIAHNGDEFDNKKAKAKFIEHGLTPPSPYKTIDTKKVAKSQFKFNSNKLDDLGKLLGVGRKHKTGGFDLWLGCMANDPASWKLMATYNKQDVLLLERVYLKLLPWIQNHPNLAMWNGNTSCPKCGHKRLKSKGIYHTKTSSYRRYLCLGCGGHSRTRLSEKTAKPELVNL